MKPLSRFYIRLYILREVFIKHWILYFKYIIPPCPPHSVVHNDLPCILDIVEFRVILIFVPSPRHVGRNVGKQVHVIIPFATTCPGTEIIYNTMRTFMKRKLDKMDSTCIHNIMLYISMYSYVCTGVVVRVFECSLLSCVPCLYNLVV